MSLQRRRLHTPITTAQFNFLDRTWKGFARALDRNDFSLFAHGDGIRCRLDVPGFKYCLALARGKIEVSPQDKLRWRRHHMLAFLIFEDCVAEVIGLFEQNMGQTQSGRARRCTQARRARSDNCNAIGFTHGAHVPPKTYQCDLF